MPLALLSLFFFLLLLLELQILVPILLLVFFWDRLLDESGLDVGVLPTCALRLC
jgi:hypothetical protein